MPRIVVSFTKPERVGRYFDALRTAGGPAVEIVDAWSRKPPEEGAWGDLLEAADGLLLTGGSDVEPWRYGQDEHAAAGLEKAPARDEMEWSLLEAAREKRLPVFGICRGHQVINAFLGGTLWQDLGESSAAASEAHDFRDGDRRRIAHGLVGIDASHPLGALLEAAGSLEVNSLHHQAVRELASGMRVVAEGPSGIVEAMALDDDAWWVWSVQWHPEELVRPEDPPAHRALFQRFLAAANEAAARRDPEGTTPPLTFAEPVVPAE